MGNLVRLSFFLLGCSICFKKMSGNCFCLLMLGILFGKRLLILVVFCFFLMYNFMMFLMLLNLGFLEKILVSFCVMIVCVLFVRKFDILE